MPDACLTGESCQASRTAPRKLDKGFPRQLPNLKGAKFRSQHSLLEGAAKDRQNKRHLSVLRRTRQPGSKGSTPSMPRRACQAGDIDASLTIKETILITQGIFVALFKPSEALPRFFHLGSHPNRPVTPSISAPELRCLNRPCFQCCLASPQLR